ncbi:MAG: class I SAM-dependent methyltransferase [Planctomycetes bacterium]|nr:class I SAM-dependent methyltransferase [Planctomycetota bacterium]
MDRYELYELCVQSPDDLAGLLRAIHGGDARILGEDFSGTAALSRAWVRRVDGGRAIAVDHDPEPRSRARPHDAITLVTGDVRAATDPRHHRVDVLHVGNFSIGEWHTRPDLVDYLRHARARLADGGVLVCDLYGGETAFAAGTVECEHPAPDGRTVLYTWEQREANPVTGMVVNAMHFQVRRGETIEQDLPDAFVYRWRLWGAPELRDAMADAGFTTTEVYAKVPAAVDDEGRVYPHLVHGPEDLDESFDVLVVGRT